VFITKYCDFQTEELLLNVVNAG